MRKDVLRTTGERAVCLIVLPLLGIAIHDTLKLSAAEAAYRVNTTKSLATAVRLEPSNADYHELLAEHLEEDGRNADRDRELAARLSPLESKYWIDLAVQAESQGDEARAEKLYLRAASVDLMFLPRWSLMNFYFRRHDPVNFWRWAKEALYMGHDDPTAAFRLCWLMTDDPHRAADIIPARNDIRESYLNFLIVTQRFQALSPIDRETAESADAGDLPYLVDYCERTLVANPASAVTVWNALCRKRLEPYNPLFPDKQNVVTNGDFRRNPTERGFDWRIPVVDGSRVSTRNSAEGMSIELNGDQPEDCVLLFQFIPLTPGRNYRIAYEYTSASASPSSGLRWEIVDSSTDAPIARTDLLKLNGDGVSERADFTAGAGGSAKAILRYKREPGTVRHEETVVLRAVTIEPTP
ncbi:MAG TPA: hypothetical protein VFC21_03640 [Bryobacteraceae bacterium]|nr:hypothetical protein [Bryobacteraceae bacterium]